MKRTEHYYGNQQNKRQKLDFSGNTSYTADSARRISEWDDDDLNGDVLEEVCIIAELSQVPRTSAPPPKSAHYGDTLTAENKKLQEALKTKAGEVGILRSQLQENQKARQNENINNRRGIERLEEKHKANVESMKKQIEQLQSELEFKDLEVKGLVEKCKQLELKSPKVHFVQPECSAFEEKKNLFSLSQAIISKTKFQKPIPEDINDKSALVKKERIIKTEGEKLKYLLDPSFFKTREEPCVIAMFPSAANYKEHLDHAKSDKYKWIGVPKHIPRIHLLHPFIVELLRSETFSMDILEKLKNIAITILNSLLELLVFLNKLSVSVEHDKALLQDTKPGGLWKLPDLLSEQLLLPEERAIEARRTLGAICCIASSSSNGLKAMASTEFLSILHEIVVQIGKLMRPIEFSGVCLAILFFLQIFLETHDRSFIDANSLELSKNILSGVIMSRPKLNVLHEVVSTLAAGAHHTDFAAKLCNKSPPETSALYMDSRLQQALFFTPDACPLKLMLIQVKTLAHLCNSSSALRATTHAFTSWVHSSLSSSLNPPGWLFPDNDQCCNILECFCYLLTLCIPLAGKNLDVRKSFEKGIITLHNCCKSYKKKLKQSTLKLLPSRMRGSNILQLLSFKARQAASLVICEYETDGVTQETPGHNTINLTDS